jgi:predicted Zn-dependent peptidase
VRSEVTGAALGEITSELAALGGDRPLTIDELGQASQAESNAFLESFETPTRIAASLAQLAIFQLPDDYYDGYVARLLATEPAEITAAMRQLVNAEALVMLVVGDSAVVEPALAAAGVARLVYVDTDGQVTARSTSTGDD